MAVGAGKFQLYSKLDPVLAADDYRYIATQTLTDLDDPTRSMPIEPLNAHVRVRAPRFQLPPDQVLSTFPPAGSEGSYGSRLPQVVIKRRTLPWERDLEGQPSSTPWLALVLIAEGEATLEMNQPVADCITADLEGAVDSAQGNCLVIKKSVIDRVFPTKLDVPLLAHAREVDINDTELMMGDDDGFLSVVVSNRLPLAGVGEDGGPAPVKYLACLVNLEGQFDRLLPEAPPPVFRTLSPEVFAATVMTTAGYDHVVMGGPTPTGPVDPTVVDPGTVLPGFDDAVVAPSPMAAPRAQTADGNFVGSNVVTTGTPPYSIPSGWTLEDAEATESTAYTAMASDFVVAAPATETLEYDPEYKFPVLLHWSFVSFGDQTFRFLMEKLDSGLIGTVGADRDDAPGLDGREPLEVVETGHVGLVHRTRHGDPIRSWYRGPLSPHPADESAERLPLAHVSDQLRIVVPDGREDLSLASAFEIGRLLALARPSAIAAMMAWRQTGYHVERNRAIWNFHNEFLEDFTGNQIDPGLIGLATELGRGLIRKMADEPELFLGGPRALVDPGRPLEWVAPAPEMVGLGFGVGREAFVGQVADALDQLKNVRELPGTDLQRDLSTSQVRDDLHRVVESSLVDLVSDTLDLGIDFGGIDPGGVGGIDPGGVGGIDPGGVGGIDPGGVGGIDPGVIGGGAVIDPGVVGGIDIGTIVGPTVPGTIAVGDIAAPISDRFGPGGPRPRRASGRTSHRPAQADNDSGHDDTEGDRS